MAEAKVLDMRKVPSLDANRKGKLDFIITYQTDPLHTFVLLTPVEGFTEAVLHETIKRDQEQRAKIVGKVFPL